jgi:hypothetical protein
MTEQQTFTSEQARRIGEEIGIDWASSPFDVEQFRMGMNVELEHGLHDLRTNVTDSDPVVTGKIALAHLKEVPDYYTRLGRMEEEAKREQGSRDRSSTGAIWLTRAPCTLQPLPGDIHSSVGG